MIISIGGSERDIKFNFNVISFYSRLHKTHYIDMVKRFSYDPIGLARDLIYSSLKTYPSGDLPDNFNLLMVGEWMEEVKQEDLNELQVGVLSALGLNEKDEKPVKKKNPKPITL